MASFSPKKVADPKRDQNQIARALIRLLCHVPEAQSQGGKKLPPRRLFSAGSMLAQRRRRWANVEPALDKRLVFAGHDQPNRHQRWDNDIR